MNKNLIIMLLFLAGILLFLEFSLRFYIFGADAFSYRMTNSYGVLVDSGLVQRAKNTDIYYELKPNIDTVFAGKHFVTNSQGLADKEYPLAKPDNTYRIAVVGSSWTMATSVALEDAYHTLLEQRLAEHFQPQQVEVINFGVENYGLGEIVASVRYKVLGYDPDMIIFPSTAVTPTFLWEDDKPPFTPTEVVPSFWQSYLYSTVAELFGHRAYPRTMRPQVKKQHGGYMRQVRRSLEELNELTADRGIDVVFVWFTHKGYNETMVNTTADIAAEQGLQFVHVHVDDVAAEMGMAGVAHYDRRTKNHPNETGHRLIAEKLYSSIWGSRESAANQPQ